MQTPITTITSITTITNSSKTDAADSMGSNDFVNDLRMSSMTDSANDGVEAVVRIGGVFHYTNGTIRFR